MKHSLVLLFAMITLPALAAGPNDGIYTITEAPVATLTSGYVTVHQNGDIVVLIDLDADRFEFSVFQGIRVGDQAELGLVLSPYTAAASFRLNFIDTVNATIELLSCVPGEGVVCNADPGATLTMTRVF